MSTPDGILFNIGSYVRWSGTPSTAVALVSALLAASDHIGNGMDITSWTSAGNAAVRVGICRERPLIDLNRLEVKCVARKRPDGSGSYRGCCFAGAPIR